MTTTVDSDCSCNCNFFQLESDPFGDLDSDDEAEHVYGNLGDRTLLNSQSISDSSDCKLNDHDISIPSTENASLLDLRSSCKPKLQDGEQKMDDYTRKLALHALSCLFMLVHLMTSAYYLSFKAKLYTSNLLGVAKAPWLVIVWLLELAYFCATLIAALDNLLPPNNRPKLQFGGLYHPTVHVLLPCCKEPTEVSVESIRAALKLDYPRDRFKVLVLDDGADDELKAICEALQVETGGQVLYLRRTKVPGVPHHFKCGNLNYGLQHSNSEYVVMMDADMILHPSFLVRLLPHIMNSPNVAFVQIPQTFYNLPCGDPLSDSSMMGYETALVHRDSIGCATCVGTGAVFRRKHLDAIGGFQPQSITEDTTTAFALFNRGYESVYLNEKLQIGLVPWTFEGYVKQRCRWGKGAMQQFRSTWKEMLFRKNGSRLGFVQKVLYFWHTGFYFLSIFNLLLMATLFCALLFRLKLTVGTEDENRALITSLAATLIAWRLSWFFVWLQVPESTQSRNRDESWFWWMTPFFCKMIMESIFSYESTFQFVPTSTVDRNAAKENQARQGHGQLEFSPSGWWKQLQLVRFHMGFTVVILSVVVGKVYVAWHNFGLDDCRESLYVFGLSFFLVTTCVHMMLPVMYILFPPNFKPSERKALLTYDEEGTPVFNPPVCATKWSWSLLYYEAVSCGVLAFWVFVLWMVRTEADKKWCREGPV